MARCYNRARLISCSQPSGELHWTEVFHQMAEDSVYYVRYVFVYVVYYYAVHYVYWKSMYIFLVFV